MKCENRPGRGQPRSHYRASIQLALTIPRFLQKPWEAHRGSDSRGRNKFGCLWSSLSRLVCFRRRSLRKRVERPTGPPPRRAPARTRPPPAPAPGFEPPVCELAHLPPPRPPGNLASTWRARSPLPRALLPNPKPTAVLQRCSRRPQTQGRPLCTPGASLWLPLPAPLSSVGDRKRSRARAAGAQTVKRRKGKRGGRWP